MRAKLHKTLVTGGAGFIGSAFVREAARRRQPIVVIDSLNYAGDLNRLSPVKGKHKFYKADITDEAAVMRIVDKERPATIVHFAAETHVDRSIMDAAPFIETNIRGTHHLIEAALIHKVARFIHISTDEVYGESKRGRFKEEAPLAPRNPYAATKASAELLVRSAAATYGLRAIIVRPCNNYGPWQYPEKFIPVIMAKAMHEEKVPVYGKGEQIREWLYVDDCARAIHFIAKKGAIGETYNIASHHEQTNLTTAKAVLKALGKSNKLITFVQDRPGHDFRYSVDDAKLRRLGWKPQVGFREGVKRTVNWYNQQQRWVADKRLHLADYWKKIYR
jgi:dTDP-glucose 4,6-dehydratase